MKFHGFVQAGGGSTRFGSDKALAEFNGKTLLARTGVLLAGACDDVHVVAASFKYEGVAWPVIADRWPGEGPLGGILTALMYSSNEQGSDPSEVTPSWAVILSCDMPFLTQDFIEYLVQRARESRGKVVVPESSNGLEPLCACWRVDCLSGIQELFQAGVRTVSEAMRRLPMEVLDESAWKRFDSDGRLFWNMNTPDDYAEAQRILQAENQ